VILFSILILILQKLKNRKAALLKTSALTGEEKKKWEVVMRLDVMSSEESDSGSDSDGQNMFIKHPLPWRSDKVNSLFKSLDHKVLKGQSKRSQKMTQSRITGFSSERPQPVGLPDWAIKP